MNYIANLENGFTSDLKLIKNEEIIDKATYRSIISIRCRPRILYGLGKVQKETNNEVTPFRTILSTIGTPTYKPAKFL